MLKPSCCRISATFEASLGGGFVSMFQFNYNHRDLNPTDKFTELLRTIIYAPSIIYMGEE
jgi:hypothetical protein